MAAIATWTAALALALFAALGTARADQLHTVLAQKHLRCGVYADVPPFAYADQRSRQMVGMDVDLCGAVAKQLGVELQLVPLSVESRIPELQMGRVDILIANLAYSRSRAKQIEFSYAYYLGREELVVHRADAGQPLSFFRGKRISSTKGSTSEQSIHINHGVAVTYQDTGAAYLSLQQYKVRGFVTNSMTAHKLVQQVAAAGIQLAMLEQPMALEPIAIGMRKGESALRDRVNQALLQMDAQGQIDAIWQHWLGPGTPYNMRRSDRVTNIDTLDFTPLP